MIIIRKFRAFSFYDVFITSYFLSISFPTFMLSFHLIECLRTCQVKNRSSKVVELLALYLIHIYMNSFWHINCLFDIPIKVFVNSLQNKKVAMKTNRSWMSNKLENRYKFWCQNDANSKIILNGHKLLIFPLFLIN